MSTGPLSEKVYEQILGRILDGTMKPGQIFNRRQLAAELNVSVAPVLEAMLELEGEGLVVTLPRKGTRVRSFSLKDLTDQLILREALECQAARLYCGDRIQQNVAHLNELAAGVDAGDTMSIEHVKQEVRFHQTLVTLADCPPLTAAYERVMKVGMFCAVQILHPDPVHAPRFSHVKLVKQLMAHDPDHAEAVIRAHIQSGKEALFELASTVDFSGGAVSGRMPGGGSGQQPSRAQVGT